MTPDTNLHVVFGTGPLGRAVMNELGTRDRDMMEKLQRRKQEAFAALVEAQKQHQITHYVR